MNQNTSSSKSLLNTARVGLHDYRSAREKQVWRQFLNTISEKHIQKYSKTHLELKEALFKRTFNLHAINLHSTLIKSLRSANPGVAKLLIEGGAELNEIDIIGQTALIIAAGAGYFDVVKLLVANGADLEKTDSEHHSALFNSILKAQTHVSKHLIQAGANINCLRKYRNMNALIYAAMAGQTEVVKALIEAGSQLDV